VTDPQSRWVDPNKPSPISPRAPLILAVSAVALTLVVVATLVAVLLFTSRAGSARSAIGDIALIKRNAPVDEPFTKSILVVPVTISDQAAQKSAALLQQVPVRADRGVRPVSGRQPELYGATGETFPCDAVTLANDLDADPATANAWGLALGLTPQQIPSYLNTLTAVVLMGDTWVTSHTSTDAVAHPTQSILQSGTAVLVDPLGVPRVHCVSGAPLAPPANQNLTDYRLDGDTWDGFSPQTVVTVNYASAGAPEPLGDFTLLDVSSGEQVIRKAGGTINLGAATVPLPDPAVMNVAPHPTTPR
jgi:hypothetical protein